jgi:hypothetical protein
MALSCAKRDYQLYEPADGDSLHQRLADGATFDNTLVPGRRGHQLSASRLRRSGPPAG